MYVLQIHLVLRLKRGGTGQVNCFLHVPKTKMQREIYLLFMFATYQLEKQFASWLEHISVVWTTLCLFAMLVHVSRYPTFRPGSKWVLWGGGSGNLEVAGPPTSQCRSSG